MERRSFLTLLGPAIASQALAVRGLSAMATTQLIEARNESDSSIAVPVTFTKSQAKKGETLQIRIDYFGTVFIESDFAMQTIGPIDLRSNQVVDVGKLTGAGVFGLRIVDGSTRYAASVVVLPQAADMFSIAPIEVTRSNPTTVPYVQSTFDKYVAAITSARVEAAYSKAKTAYVAEAAAAIGGTFIICTMSFAGGLTFPACISSVASNVIGFGVKVNDLLIDEMVSDNKLTLAEGSYLKKLVGFAAIAPDIVMLPQAATKADSMMRAMKIMNGGVDFVTDNQAAQVVVKNQSSLAYRTIFLIKFLK